MEKEQGFDDTIGYTEVVSVSTSYSRCSNFMFFSCSMTCLPHGLHIDFLWLVCIYSIDTILYPYALPLESIPLLILSLWLSVTWALWVKVIISIKNFVQGYLPYILKSNSLCSTTLAYPKWPCAFLKVNMCIICYMTLSLLDPSTIFYHATQLCDCVTVTCHFFSYFLNQQFITWSTVADHSNYFITTYKKHRLHDKKKTNERER